MERVAVGVAVLVLLANALPVVLGLVRLYRGRTPKPLSAEDAAIFRAHRILREDS